MTIYPVDIPAMKEWISERLPEYLEDLRTLVNVDCGTSNKDGVDAVGRILREKLQSAGAKLTEFPLTKFGDCCLATWCGSGQARVLLSGHLDTVFPDGTATERPMQIVGNRIYGPGVSDMKSGLLSGLYSMRMLQFIGFDDFAEIRFFLNTDEEVGSHTSRKLYQPLVNDVDAALVLESARASGDIVSARKGGAAYRFTVHGRQAHAGVEIEKGANAVVELARCIQELNALNGLNPGTTVNVGVIGGGTVSNVVPDLAWADIDGRFVTITAAKSLDQQVRKIATRTSIAGTHIEIMGGIEKGPMEKTSATTYLVELGQDVGRLLGISFQDVLTGGTSDGNLISELGVPVLDGLGPIGGLDHSPKEYLELDSIVPRTCLLSGLIAAICENRDRLRGIREKG